MLNPFFQQMINHKINSLTTKELVALSHQHQMPITAEQASKVIQVIQSEPIDVGNRTQVERMIKRLQTEVDPNVSKVISQLLNQYGHLLDQL
ncbi:DUF2624 domain-containing protein [Alkalihalobacterium chitinilyticum]|uniref:DUF2624 domain-containing protein n=1 Tax=Alkalihalobacterium chitinilyticum TaxID=2980103 RepID=A0ABT5VHI3_9BACI|nr:DUF2624 domain-containing protein [Alkalihalobacterium chitinilyticum]MDE5413923.1 DUF2624 domain-containing protein [Alkalihalobacterium chitinilyticum]